MKFWLKSARTGERGFTLIEILVAVAISGTIGIGLTMMAIQVMNVNSLANNKVVAIKQVENATYWLNRDVRVAQTIQPSGGSGFPLNLSWVEWDGTTHQVTYSLQSGDFLRSSSVNATQPSVLTVAQHISTSANETNCQYSNGVLNYTLTATLSGFRPATETRVDQVTPRSAQ